MLAIRLAVWFVLLSSLPILVLVFFVRQNAYAALVNLENRHHYDMAALLARQVATSDSSEDAQSLFSTLEGSGLSAFILRDDGTYLAHVDGRKINGTAEGDFSPDVVQTILTERDGLYSKPSSPNFFAFTPVPGQEAVVVIAAPDSAVFSVIRQLEEDSYLQILITVLIVFAGSGVVIWLLVGLPVRKLTQAAEQLRAGQLEVQVDSGDMIDDLALLGTSFNTMADRIRDLVEDLERRVKERTAELSAANEQLERQNIQFQQTNRELAHEIDERTRAERQAQRQLQYVRALSACSQTLLATSGGEADNRRLLVEALQPLVEPARVSKIFLYENFNDPERGFCSRFVMDACAPGIPSAQDDPRSAVIPWSIAPDENRRRLEAGEPVGGPVRGIFASTPSFRDDLLEIQILSVLFLPIHFGECWWGYVGFDDRLDERAWTEAEILLLGAAAEILSSTLQRWQAEEKLRTMNDRLEQQVKVRTGELSDAVELLQQEIEERERAEAELQRVLASLERRVAARTQELSTFLDLTVLAGRADNLIEVFQQAMSRILDITRSRIICIHLLDDERSGLRLATEQNVPEDDLSDLQVVDPPPGFRRWLGRPDDPLVTTSLANLKILPPAFRLAGCQTYLGAQIRVGQRIRGILSCYRFSGRGYALDEVSLVGALAEQMGMVLETHRLRQTAEEMAVLEERRRLARELHDSVTQSLYSLTLFARSGREAAEDKDIARLAPNLTDIEETALHTLQEMRLLLYELRAPSLEREGLVQAIDTRLNLVERRAGLQVSYEVGLVQPKLPKPIELELYWLAIEALNNIIKHAEARAVTVSLWAVNGRVHLDISDDGRGFDPRQPVGGFGLPGMRERVERLGGVLNIGSAPGRGAKISIEVGLSDG